MWTPLPLLAALTLAPAQPPAAGGLNLINVRNTYGELGGTRPDAPLLSADILFVGFDIDNITISPSGQVKYTMAMEVTDKAGKSWYKNDPAEKVDYAPLGGTRLPGRAYMAVGLDQPAGEYNLRVTVVDLATKATKALDRKFTVLPRDFGIVAVNASADVEGKVSAPTTGVVGQPLFVQFGVVGFARDAAKKQPHLVCEMLALDEAGRPTVQYPNTLVIDEREKVDEKEPGLSVRFSFPMTRAGKYTVRLRATDKVANKTYTYDLPVAVVPPAN